MVADCKIKERKWKMENVVIRREQLLSPRKDVPWASEMILNPGIVEDPESGRIHMILRTSGPTPEKRLEGKPMPFPVYFGYGYSDDGGKSFEFDFSKPCLSPAVEYQEEKMWIVNGRGEKVPNYVNGCVEDPRIFMVEGECYCAVAGRTFPAGPYWEHDEPVQCMPEWAKKSDSPIGNIKNVTTTVLYKIDLKALEKGDYGKAFTYITDLTDPEKGEDRDVFIFPEKMMIDGEMQYVMLHRPHHPDNYEGIDEKNPSIVISAAKDFYSFAKNASRRKVLYAPHLPWQKEKVGGSTQPLNIGNGEWLFNFHGKEDEENGYAQSFMILKEKENDFPEITHLCPEKWIVDEEDFEKPAKFKTPCVFFTGILKKDNALLVSYGAADEHAAIMEIDFDKVIKTLRNYPYNG